MCMCVCVYQLYMSQVKNCIDLNIEIEIWKMTKGLTTEKENKETLILIDG